MSFLACDRVTRAVAGSCECDLVTLLGGCGDEMEAGGTGEEVPTNFAATGLSWLGRFVSERVLG